MQMAYGRRDSNGTPLIANVSQLPVHLDDHMAQLLTCLRWFSVVVRGGERNSNA